MPIQNTAAMKVMNSMDLRRTQILNTNNGF